MARLNEDEQKLYDELHARMNAPDEDDDYEVEIYDTAAGKGARVPYKSAKGWLADVFGIGAAPAGPDPGEGDPAPGGSAPSARGQGAKKTGQSGGYFARQE